MATTRPDAPARITHEERVRAFMASIPKRRRDRIEAKYSVLADYDEKQIRHNEAAWPPGVLDELEVLPGPTHRSPTKGDRNFQEA